MSAVCYMPSYQASSWDWQDNSSENKKGTTLHLCVDQKKKKRP